MKNGYPHTFVASWILFDNGQRGARGWLAEGVAATLFYFCRYFPLGIGCLK